jgi:hypothetical protein
MANPWGRLEDGLGQGLRFEPAGSNGGAQDADTMALELVGGGQDSWLLTIYADVGRGVSMLGRIRTLPWGQGARTVAICAHPGARAWEVRGKRIGPQGAWNPPNEMPGATGAPSSLSRGEGANLIGVNISCTPRVGGPWGITPIRGFSERAVDSLYVTGANGAEVVRGNVLGWTALNTTAVDAHVVINTGTPILVPANGGFVQGGQIIYKGYANFFSFAGTTEYRVDYERENPFEKAGEFP